MKTNKILSLLSLVVAVMSVPGCMGGVDYTADLSLMPKFVAQNFAREATTLSDSVDLYVDYSTCVAEASNSAFYAAVRPTFVDCSPTFYSIKGSTIKKETDNRQQVYALLSNIKEVNHADIKQAVRNIVNSNRQAVLITDGEYYQKGAIRDNLNNPYLAEEFRTWLRAGRDIYIYSEPYLESGRFNKYRYYMLFTDSELENDIHERFSRNAPKMESVKMIHLSNGVPTVSVVKDYPDMNLAVSPMRENCVCNTLLEVQEWGISWKDMYSWLGDQDMSIDDRYLFRGLFVDRFVSDCYKIEEVEPVVYQVYDAYQEFCDSTYTEGSLPVAGRLKEIKDVFSIDEDLFEETGEIVLCIDEDFDGIGDALSTETPNLLKVDFVITEASDNFSDKEEFNAAFKWNSISAAQGYAPNTSIYESISQVIKDPYFNPARNEAVIYTVYISTSRVK